MIWPVLARRGNDMLFMTHRSMTDLVAFACRTGAFIRDRLQLKKHFTRLTTRSLLQLASRQAAHHFAVNQPETRFLPFTQEKPDCAQWTRWVAERNGHRGQVGLSEMIRVHAVFLPIVAIIVACHEEIPYGTAAKRKSVISDWVIRRTFASSVKPNVRRRRNFGTVRQRSFRCGQE
jgi:hypothetical protein